MTDYPRTEEEIAADFVQRRSGLLKALTEGTQRARRPIRVLSFGQGDIKLARAQTPMTSITTAIRNGRTNASTVGMAAMLGCRWAQ